MLSALWRYETVVSRSSIVFNCGAEFRLLDADGNAYYEGDFKDLDNQCVDDAFEPLDWAERTDARTKMQYRKRGTIKWKML